MRTSASRIALPFVLLVVLVAATIGATTVWLVGRTVLGTMRERLDETARLFSGSHFPLSDETATRLARYIRADIVVALPQGRLQASSLSPEQASAFERALGAGLRPRPGELASVDLEGEQRLVAATPLESSGRTLYLIYSPELVSAERWRALGPVLFVSLVSVVLTVVLGTIKERAVVREHTRDLERLVSALAHEVKNPLGAIGLTVETLRGAVATDRDREAIGVVTSEVERLSLLVDELRLLGRKLPWSFEPASVRPGEIVSAASRLLERTIAHRGLALEVVDRAPEARAWVDPRAFKQALLNLLLNAIDATPRGGAVRIELAPGRKGSVAVTVSDAGPGVPDAIRERLFEPFVTTKQGGTGLGLALARLIAEAHGGKLTLVASGEKGATFVLELPSSDSAPPGPRSG